MADQDAKDTDFIDPVEFMMSGEQVHRDVQFSEEIVTALKTVYDPEIPVDIYELGLIYDVKVENGHAETKMTLTAPGCPVAGTMPGMVEQALLMLDSIDSATVELVWEPPWDPSRMSEVARLELGME